MRSRACDAGVHCDLRSYGGCRRGLLLVVGDDPVSR
eukprot:CAMPEP_0196723880 /NCGR_PEP_ID=MMETSP1091-20130531/5938_1 /TAXON_ID=302021 /ORGANISM="Rhodomonas sp., Strain CCMP768" /LENGTH=35 /DNA_ID= /DNA_START= /DNA_END= /DNA_ORIENTATION=